MPKEGFRTFLFVLRQEIEIFISIFMTENPKQVLNVNEALWFLDSAILCDISSHVKELNIHGKGN